MPPAHRSLAACAALAVLLAGASHSRAQAPMVTGSFGGARPAPSTVHVILTAGHRNNGPKSPGAVGERALTLRYADAYAERLLAEGFKVHYLQRMDDDGRPDWYSAGLSKVALRATSVAQSLDDGQPIVMLDVHMEAPSAAAGVFAIVPDGATLGPRLDPPDSWENNDRSRRLARLLAARISAATGIPIRQAKDKGVMSETQTGVALEQHSRLAMFRNTAPVRARMERLVVEHGNLRSDAVQLRAAGTPGKVASAVADALRTYYGVRPPAPPMPRPAAAPRPPAGGYARAGVVPPLDGMDHRVNGIEFVAARRRVTIARNGIPGLQYADPASAAVRAPFRAGEVVEVVYFVRGGRFENDDRWWVAFDGSRIPMAGTVEKLRKE